MSIIASSSASRTGLSASGSGLPSSTIFTRLVVAARIDAKTLHLACMQNGALWCSFSMMPSKPTSSAQPVVLEVLVVEPAARDRIEVLVGEHQRGGAELPARLSVG